MSSNKILFKAPANVSRSPKKTETRGVERFFGAAKFVSYSSYGKPVKGLALVPKLELKKRPLSPPPKAVMSREFKPLKLQLKPTRKPEFKPLEPRKVNFSLNLLKGVKAKQVAGGRVPGGETQRSLHQKNRSQSCRGETVGISPACEGPELWVAARSRAGFSLDNSKRGNQDSFFSRPNCLPRQAVSIYGVCDGHGAHGHKISAFIANLLPGLLEEGLAREFSCRENSSRVKEAVMGCVKTGMEELVARLFAREDIDCQFSGSTLCLIVIVREQLFAFNVGDSRAVHFSALKGWPLWTSFPLTEDHKPDSLLEAERIIRFGGLIAAARDAQGNRAGPLRVWLKGQTIPGLAMTRSVGDRIAERIGVTWKPTFLSKRIKLFNNSVLNSRKSEITFYHSEDKLSPLPDPEHRIFDFRSLQEEPTRHFLKPQQIRRKFLNTSLDRQAPSPPQDPNESHIIIIASDGLWDIMTNVEISKCVGPFYPAKMIEEACDRLMDEALKKWKKANYDSSDDVTFIIVFVYVR